MLLQACVTIERSIEGNTRGHHSVNNLNTSANSIVKKKNERHCLPAAVSRQSYSGMTERTELWRGAMLCNCKPHTVVQ
jgi:hypothetical protein